MGNTESNVTSGVKKQAGTSEQPLYKLVDLKGGGLLVDMMKRAAQTKQYAELDHAIKTKVEPFLYNKGKGRLIPITQLVLLRNCERSRTKLLPLLKNMEDPESEFDMDRDGNPGDFQPAPDGVQEDFQDLNKKYRDVCWDLKKRGAVGETCLHLCMLNATSLHDDLAKRLLKFYPKLINDIYMSDEYYGEGLLHIAIVNEDPAMVKFLLDHGANFHERCFGNFMCTEDQKATRSDSLDHEYIRLLGEYPLSFAACLGQEESYRLMLAKGANPDNPDTNGNTVLHMLVIHNKVAMFDMAYELGANLSLKNVVCLTPLTLAAKLAKVEIFFHILNIEREIYWQIGSIACAAYPLSQIDTIDNETGDISKNSALNLVVFGDKDEHLELMDGVLVDLLVAKWNTYVKFRFYRQFISFFFYFLISLICFTLRPGPSTTTTTTTTTTTSVSQSNSTSPDTFYAAPPAKVLNLSTTETTAKKDGFGISKNLFRLTSAAGDELLRSPGNGTQKAPSEISRNSWNNSENYSQSNKTKRTLNVEVEKYLRVNESNALILEKETTEIEEGDKSSSRDKSGSSLVKRQGTVTNGKANSEINSTIKTQNHSGDVEYEKESGPDCRLLSYEKTEDKIRIAAEISMEIGSILYILAALREARFLGIHMFIENLMTAPSRVMFLSSCCIMQMVPWLRFTCKGESEDMVAVIIMLTTAPYFLFFAAYYIIFLSFDNPKTPDGVDDSGANPMQSPVESIMAMFLMSLTNFGEYYGAFEKTEHEFVAKLMFVIYMGIVAILLVNMLIAMMGNTYQKIAETRNEWQRQWARIVLVVERGVSPHERLKKLMLYSQPMSDGRRALVLRLHQTPEDKEEMKDILDMKRVHNRMVQRRLAKGNKNLYSVSPKSGAKSNFHGPVPPLKSIPPKPIKS